MNACHVIGCTVVVSLTLVTACTKPQEIELVAGTAGGSGNLDGKGDAARFDFPKQIVVAADGRTLILEGLSSRIRALAPDGTVSTLAMRSILMPDGSKYQPRPTAIAFDRHGGLIAVDGYAHAVLRIDSAGAASILAGKVNEAGDRDGIGLQSRFSIPLAIALAPDGGIVVVDQRGTRFRRIEARGRVSTLTVAPPERIPDLYYTDLAIEPDGRMWAVAEKAHRVVAFSADGKVLRVYGSEPAGARSSDSATNYRDGRGDEALFNEPAQISIRGDLILVADRLNGAVRRLGRDGTVSTVLRSPCALYRVCTPDAAQLKQPFLKSIDGIAIISPDSALLSSATSEAVYRFSFDGSVDRVAGLPPLWSQAREQDVFSGCASMVVPPPSKKGEMWCLGAIPSLYRIGPSGAQTILDIRQEGAALRARVNAANPAAGSWPSDRLTELGYFTSAVTDSDGVLYFADSSHHVVARWDPSRRDAGFSIVAGTFNQSGFANGLAMSALFNKPARVALDGGHTLYVVDSGNHMIRRIDRDGVVSTLAGIAGKQGARDGLAARATFDNPTSIALADDDAVLVSDWGNGTIRRIEKGHVTTLIRPHFEGEHATNNACRCGGLRPYHITMGPDRAIWFLTSDADRVFRMSDTGLAQVVVGAVGSRGYRGDVLPGSLPHTRALAFSSDGDLWLGGADAVLRIKAAAWRRQAAVTAGLVSPGSASTPKTLGTRASIE